MTEVTQTPTEAPSPPHVEVPMQETPFTPAPAEKIQERLTQVASEGRNPKNRDRVMNRLAPATRKKLTLGSSNYDTGYDVHQAIVDTVLGENNPVLQNGGRQKIAGEAVAAIRATGVKITDKTIPLDALVREFVVQAYGPDILPKSTGNRIKQALKDDDIRPQAKEKPALETTPTTEPADEKVSRTKAIVARIKSYGSNPRKALEDLQNLDAVIVKGLDLFAEGTNQVLDQINTAGGLIGAKKPAVPVPDRATSPQGATVAEKIKKIHAQDPDEQPKQTTQTTLTPTNIPEEDNLPRFTIPSRPLDIKPVEDKTHRDHTGPTTDEATARLEAIANGTASPAPVENAAAIPNAPLPIGGGSPSVTESTSPAIQPAAALDTRASDIAAFRDRAGIPTDEPYPSNTTRLNTLTTEHGLPPFLDPSAKQPFEKGLPTSDNAPTPDYTGPEENDEQAATNLRHSSYDEPTQDEEAAQALEYSSLSSTQAELDARSSAVERRQKFDERHIPLPQDDGSIEENDQEAALQLEESAIPETTDDRSEEEQNHDTTAARELEASATEDDVEATLPPQDNAPEPEYDETEENEVLSQGEPLQSEAGVSATTAPNTNEQPVPPVVDDEATLSQARSYALNNDFYRASAAYRALLPRAFLNRDQANEIITDLRELTTQNPGNADLHRVLGDMYMRMGRFQQAIEEFDAVLIQRKAAEEIDSVVV